jgi:phage-related protein
LNTQEKHYESSRAAIRSSVYVLHAFQKKSKSGRETPRRDMELIEQRLREAERIAKGRKS